MNDLWERQAKETAKAYAAFVEYRDTPAYQRTVANVMQRHASAGRWAAQHAWERRAKAYDDHIDKLSRSRRESVLTNAMNRHANIAEHLISLLRNDDLKPSEIDRICKRIRGLKDAAEVSRVSLGYVQPREDDTMLGDNVESAAERARGILDEETEGVDSWLP